MGKQSNAPMGNVVQIDEAKIQDHLGKVVRGTVEETLNGLLDAEADRVAGAGRYERSEGRRDTRAGHYERDLHTRAGKVRLKVPKLRRLPLESAIIERYRRREASVEEALMEMYLAGVSVRRVEDITEALWGSRVSAGTVSRLNHKVYERIEAWRNAPIEGRFPYVYLDGLVLKRSWGGEVRSVSVLVAIGVDTEGYRRILGVCEGAKEDKAGWNGFLQHLKERPGRRCPLHLRCVHGAGGESGRALPGGPLAALHRAFLPQCLQRGAHAQGPGGGGHAEGYSRCGGSRGRAGDRQPRHRQAQGDDVSSPVPDTGQK